MPCSIDRFVLWCYVLKFCRNKSYYLEGHDSLFGWRSALGMWRVALASAESNAAPKRQRSPEQPDPQGNTQNNSRKNIYKSLIIRCLCV